MPFEAVARTQSVAVPAARGVYWNDHRRHAYGSCSLPSSAGDQCAPSSSDTSTRVTSGAPERANPRSVTGEPTRASEGASVTLDFTNSDVTGSISSGLNATPGAPGFFG